MKTKSCFYQFYYKIKLKAICLLVSVTAFVNIIYSQCGAGYSSATINWDNLDYIHNRGGYYSSSNPVTGLPFVTSSMWQSQRFAIGTSSMTINTTIPVGLSGSLFGELTTHTGETGAYGTGADLAFVRADATTATVTLTFSTEVKNLKFSVFDIDQEVTFAPTATNAAASAVSITLTKAAGASSGIPLNGSAAATTVSGTAPVANWPVGGGSGTSYAVTSNLGTLNVDIAGPVKTVTLTFSNDGNLGDFWISDITACVPDPGFPTNYHSTYVQPFTGQPSYFLASPQNLNVYMVNASTGVAQYVFSDPGTTGTKLNSLAYDPVNKYLYYTMDGASQSPVNRAVKKYDFNTGTISTVIADINSLGIPTFIQGVEFAGAAFYNGSLYLGVEEGDGTSFSTAAESVVWKIDFDGSGNATTATQVFGMPGDNGSGTPTHDWGDFVIKDGTLISHATSGSSANNQYIHYNMQTGVATTYAGNAESSGQLGMIYNGNTYRIKNNIALYNNDGSIGSTTAVTTTSCSAAWTGNAGDASDPFKPKSDFGDAPASYDPVALSPAVHDYACNNANLRLGTAWDQEWSKNSSSDATGDGGDEDAIATVTVMNSDGVSYNHVQPVSVFNNTGSNVTLGAWLDYDADGVFEASEGLTVTVSSNASVQNINLTWNNLTVPVGTPNTFLRIRITSGTLTTSNATGWYADGEVEDYLVVSSAPLLSLKAVHLQATVDKDNKVRLNWQTLSNNNIKGFEIQRSSDNINWKNIGWKNSDVNQTEFDFNDEQTPGGLVWYRVKLVQPDHFFQYSTVKQVFLAAPHSEIKITPSPVINYGVLYFNSSCISIATITTRTIYGNTVNTTTFNLRTGENQVPVDMSSVRPGIYLIEIRTEEGLFTRKIIKR